MCSDLAPFLRRTRSQQVVLSSRRNLFSMEIFLTGLQAGVHDCESLERVGTLTKKDVFRWGMHHKNPRSDNFIRSDLFRFYPTPGSKYYLISNVYDLSCPHFSVGLCRVFLPHCSQAEKEMKIKVSFSLLDTRDRCHYTSERQMYKNNTVEASFDRNSSITHNSMFIYNGHLRIQCSLDVEEAMDEVESCLRTVPTECDNLIQDLTTDMRSLLEGGQHSDITLNVKGEEFKAHRSILSARSSVFAAMFEHETLEKHNNRIDIVDMESKTMRHLLRFLYTGETEELATQEFLLLFVAADKYNLPKLKRLCSCSICPKITWDSALSVLTLAYLHQDDQLRQAAVEAILGNALKVMKSDEWLVFLKEYSELANSVIIELASKSNH